jgi:hypothetical protein
MEQQDLQNQVEKWKKRGFRFAYTYKEGDDLQHALTHRFVATNRKSAWQQANQLHYKGDKKIVIYEL